MGQRGGRRPGAGRKPQGLKRVLHQTPVQLAEAKIAEKLPWLVDKLMELAKGVYEERTIGEDTVYVYKNRPDRQAAEYLLDRILGKPVDRKEQGEPGAFKQGYIIRLIREDVDDDDHAAAS